MKGRMCRKRRVLCRVERGKGCLYPLSWPWIQTLTLIYLQFWPKLTTGETNSQSFSTLPMAVLQFIEKMKHKLSVVVHTYNPSTQKTEAGRL
jgi:hypothetical protein